MEIDTSFMTNLPLLAPPLRRSAAMPPSSPAAACIIIFWSFLAALVSSHFCSAPLPETKCPPFTSPLPFPFSVLPGCGHPSFQIHCSPYAAATISVNGVSFDLLRYDPNSTTLTLSPTRIQSISTLRHHNCTLNRSVSFSGSPFRVSESLCSRLSLLRSCGPTNLPNCTSCSMDCNLVKNPVHLIHDCRTFSDRRSEKSRPECQTDLLGVLDGILTVGFEVNWDENDTQDLYFSNCKSCRSANGFCGYNSSVPMKQFLCFSPQVRISRQGPNKIALLSITIFFVCILIALYLGIRIFRSRANIEEDPAVAFLRHQSADSLLPPVFTYEELESSTDHFDPKRKIGDGGFGSVYLGHLPDGQLLAVKRLHKQNSQNSFSKKSFCNEVLILSSISHPNLVRLHGYCSDPRGLLLAYDYVPNGTLSDHLHMKQSLPWKTRIDIAYQISTAIEYLHFSVIPPIVHRDITSANIFMEKDMKVKLGDFGLSRLLVCSETTGGGVWTGPQGTPGYLDPGYYQSFMLNEKSDIYSFGVVLLELITGMKAVDRNREKREVALADMVVMRIQMGLLDQVVDPVLGVDREAMEGVRAVAELAFRCVAQDKDDRPDAREMVRELKRIKAVCRGGGFNKEFKCQQCNSSCS